MKNFKTVIICSCGCPKQYHLGSIHQLGCEMHGDCKSFNPHHEESRSTRWNSKKLYVGLKL